MSIAFVKELESFRPGQERSLFKDDEGYIVVSTVPSPMGPDLDAGSNAFVATMSRLGGYTSTAEETMAFRCDENGDNENWSEIAVASGSGSRARVLADLGFTEEESK